QESAAEQARKDDEAHLDGAYGKPPLMFVIRARPFAFLGHSSPLPVCYDTVMKYLISLLAAAFVGTTLPASAQPTLAPSQMVSPSLLVTRIDVNCRVVQQ